MIHEFAIDPQSIDSYRTLQLICATTGITNGRLIAQYPKKWKRMVFESCQQYYADELLNDKDLTKITELMSNINDKLIRRGRQYEGNTNDWLNNAIEEHSKEPFRAILSNNNIDSESIIAIDDLLKNNSLWNISRDKVCKRTASELTNCAEFLFVKSNEILFVEPNFDPMQDRFRDTIEGFLDSAVSLNPDIHRLEYHTIFPMKVNSNRCYDVEEFEEYCQENLPELIRQSIELKLIIWSKIDGKDTIHARYILTEIGGIGYDFGLDLADGRHEGETTDVRILDDGVYKRRWQEYQESSEVFNREHEFIIRGTKQV